MPKTEPTANTERFRDTINVPIAIPAWGAIVMIAGALFTSGTLYQKMDALVETSRRSEDKVAVVAERQVKGLAAIEVLQAGMRDHDQRLVNDEQRLSNIERSMFMTQARAK